MHTDFSPMWHRLGDGGFGQVYEVKSRRTGLAYAVKKVRHQILEGGAAVVNSARKEFEVLKQLKHVRVSVIPIVALSPVRLLAEHCSTACSLQRLIRYMSVSIYPASWVII